MQTMASPPSPKGNAYWQQTTQNRMLMVVLGMVVLVPLLASPSNQNMQGVANYLLRVMAGLLAAILVLRARVTTRKEDIATFLGTGANLAVLVYFALSLLSAFLAPREFWRFSFVEMMRVLTGTLLYFAIAYHVRRSEHVIKIMDALCMVAGFLALAGLVSMVGQQDNLRARLFGDPQLFGAFLMILFPITVIAAVTETDMKRQITAQVAAALTLICLLMTGTRSSWAGAGVELIVLLGLSFIGRKKPENSLRRTQFFIPLLIIVACAILFAAMGGFGITLQKRLSDDSKMSSIEYRQRMWYAASEMIKNKPALGYGLGMYPFHCFEFNKAGRPVEAVLQRRPGLSEMAHNFWLQTGAEQGLIGMGAFVAIVATFLINGIRRLKFLTGGVRRSLLLASLASVAGFSVDGLGNPAWQYAQVAMFFWLILGLGVACMRPRS